MGAWRSMCAVAALTLMPGMANAAMEQATPHRCRRPGEVGTATFAETEAANIGPAWIGGLAEYWREHKYYPPAAARAGEGGSIQVMADVNRLGRVQSVRVVCPSWTLLPWPHGAMLNSGPCRRRTAIQSSASG